MSGQLWVIDGVDGAGKATQLNLLLDRLNTSSELLRGKKAHHRFFPNYQEKPWGVLTRQYLDGVFGPLETVGPYSASLLYAGDRGMHASEMRSVLESGDWILCDRYVPSNVAFQAAKIDSEEEKLTFTDWLFDTEYNLFNIPKPDGVIVLNLPIEISTRRTEVRRDEAKNRGDVLNDKVSHTDIHEQNASYMQKANEEYLKMAKRFGWHVIECAEDSRELSREEISEKIWEVVSSGSLS